MFPLSHYVVLFTLVTWNIDIARLVMPSREPGLTWLFWRCVTIFVCHTSEVWQKMIKATYLSHQWASRSQSGRFYWQRAQSYPVHCLFVSLQTNPGLSVNSCQSCRPLGSTPSATPRSEMTLRLEPRLPLRRSARCRVFGAYRVWPLQRRDHQARSFCCHAARPAVQAMDGGRTGCLHFL